ncbi:hypothetical protein SAMN05428945_0879 [Streptomyces sp. 2224.1]|uniref:hypothetical protein n=1 Tax=unclassified Streptomyces TaxID=2593676 RepID=UPI0008986CB1|nr:MULTISPECIES: hypothetical protein [unclassified Streptomyces]SEB69061.1 hypothetical protein SAMN05428945_0879 [Streptomyces sp. 2224.1]SEE49776.1 hypothetical protein SAMN05428954_2802 [Streptomyces sp. 2112.3]
MSYPPQNPYGPQQGQQPQYGYPQQQPAPPQQPSPYGPYAGGSGMPGMQPQYPVAMPGGAKAARVILFVLAGVNLIGLIIAVAGLGGVSKASHDVSPYSAAEDVTALSVSKGLLIAAIVLIVIFTVLAVTLALQFANGGNGVRVGSIVFGVGTLLLSLCTFPLGLVHTILGIMVIAFISKDESKYWFNRPRY